MFLHFTNKHRKKRCYCIGEQFILLLFPLSYILAHGGETRPFLQEKMQHFCHNDEMSTN